MVKTHLTLYLRFVPSGFSSPRKDLRGRKARGRLFWFPFSPFPSLFAFLQCRMMPLPCVPKPSGFVELQTWPQRRSPGSAASSQIWKRKLPALTRVSCAKPPGSDLYSLLFPFLWFHSISLVLPPSVGLSALLHPTELHPLHRPHLLTSFPQPGSPSDKGGALSSGQ